MCALVRHPPKWWRVVCLILVSMAWYDLEIWAATASSYPFGRYEVMLQEGTPVALGEILGIVRRQTGLPEYPLMLGVQRRLLELSILGPGNRPIQLAATQHTWPAGDRAATAEFIVERSVRQGEALTLQLRRAKAPGRVGLTVNLRNLERMLEGER